MKKIDLHVHTTESDGSLTPRQVVAHAAELGLAAIAITDHDTVAGCAEALEASFDYDVEVIPGIEISTKYGVAVHILGYCVDMASPSLDMVLDWIVYNRDSRNRKMVKLMQDDGIDITYEQMQERYGTVIGRPHFAQLLVELGRASSFQEAFDKYVEKGRKYYMPREFLTIDNAVRLIAAAGGVPVIAHPFQYKKNDEELRELIEYCIPFGLEGLECRYSGYTPQQSDYLEALAEEYGLLKTGGSDFHGTFKKRIELGRGIDNNLNVPYEYLELVKEKAADK